MIDHFVLACRDGDQSAKSLSDQLGASLVEGGRHDGRGTRNHLGSLGNCYLELLAPDPTQDPSDEVIDSFPDTPALVGWCVRTGNLLPIAEAAKRLSLTSRGPIDWTRESPNGRLSWQLLFVRDHSYGAALPFFIDWGSTPLPSDTVPVVGEKVSFSIAAPSAPPLQELLNEAQTGVSVADGPLHMALTIAGKHGELLFRTGDAFPPPFGD